MWRALPLIHKFWGFSGGIDKSGVFYDSVTKKITILNWDRGQLPICHIPGYDAGETPFKTTDKFMGIYPSYGKRLMNGFDDPLKIFAADKEALMNCLLECRTLSLV